MTCKAEFGQAFPGAAPVGPQVQPRAHGPERRKISFQRFQQLPGLGRVYFVLNGDVGLDFLAVLRGEM